MKHSILIALLSLTVSIAAPSLAIADNGYSDHKNNKWHSNKHKQKHANKNRYVAKAKLPKARHNNHHRKDVAKHNSKRHHKHYRHNEPKRSFSISWGNDFPSLNYGYDYPQKHDYRNHRDYSHRIYQRQDKQARQIRRGVRKGQLVHREARALRQEQRRIKRKLSHFKRDGRLNRHERSRIHQMLDVLLLRTIFIINVIIG